MSQSERAANPRKARWWVKLLGIFLLLGAAQWSYYFPHQEGLCKEAYEEYRVRQGIPEDDILEYDVHKYPGVDGWEVIVKYKSDPDNVYEYFFARKSYYGITVRSGGKMTLNVYDSMRNDAQYHCLYPPLWDDVRPN